ncbi:MAG: MIP/aquaporin family protein [Gemmatimonadales bacterium]
MATAAAERTRPEAAARHWAEYGIEAALLGLFMVSACGFAVLFDHPGSPAYHAVPDPLARRFLTGLAMGSTAITLIYSPWGGRSGAHFNPAATLTFLRLGRMAPRDAAWYVGAQFVGGLIGVLAAAAVLGAPLAHEKVRYAATRPGPAGLGTAWLAELIITFVLMTVVLRVSSHPRYGRLTGLSVGVLVATYITLEAPLSGMSMNPARTFASAMAAADWTAIWIYFTAPPLGMLAAAELHVRLKGRLFCAKLDHDPTKRCIHCEYRGQSPVTRDR